MTKRTTKKAKKQDRKSPRETDSQFVFRVRATETYSVSDNISQTPLRPQRDGTRCDADHSEINEGRESDSRRTAFACLPDVTVEAPKRSVSVSVLPAQVEVLVNRPLQHVAKSKGLVPDEPHRKRRRIDTACRAKTTQTSQDENSVEDDETLNDDSEAFETFEESNARDEVDEKEKRCVKSAATSKWGSAVKKQYEQVVAELEGRNGGVKMNSVSDRKKADREAEEDDEGREDFETGEPPVRKGAAVEASNATGVIETGRRCACGAETLTRSSRQKQATAGELERDNIDEDNTWNVESELKSKGRYERQFNEDTREQDRKTATATSIFRRSQYLRRLDPDGLPGEDPGTTLQQPGSIIRIALEANSMVHEPAQSKAPDRLTELTNAIAVEVFNNLKKDTFCISSYGISFVIGILEVNGSKASLKEVLKYGGFGKDGVPDCCTEVVSTLRRRGSRPQEVAVKSGLYVRDAVRYAGLRSPTRPSLQHVLTAEFKTADSSTASWNGVLFNTATFFTSWKFPFSKQATYKGIFHDQSGQKVSATFMRRTTVLPYALASDLNADVVALPYQDTDVAMVLLIWRSTPAPITTGILYDTLKSLHPALVTLHLPKFKMISLTELDGHIQSCWNDLLNCGLSNVPALFRSVHQRTLVSVSEGQEPSVLVESTKGSYKNVTLHVNRPFAFIVYQRAPTSFLYMGKVSDGSVLTAA